MGWWSGRKKREVEREGGREGEREGGRCTVACCQLLQVFEGEGSLGGELEAGSSVEGVLEDGAQLLQALDDELPGQRQQVQDPGGCTEWPHDNHMIGST